MTRRPLLIALLAFMALPRFSGAAENAVHRNFYDSKKLSTTRTACDRAAERLRRVRAGISELKFLELMEMEVLAKRGKPVDARVDGYLPERSKEANAGLGAERRALVFGYVEGANEVVVATVVLRSHRVEEVKFTEPVANSLIADASAAGGSSAEEKK